MKNYSQGEQPKMCNVIICESSTKKPILASVFENKTSKADWHWHQLKNSSDVLRGYLEA